MRSGGFRRNSQPSFRGGFQGRFRSSSADFDFAHACRLLETMESTAGVRRVFGDWSIYVNNQPPLDYMRQLVAADFSRSTPPSFPFHLLAARGAGGSNPAPFGGAHAPAFSGNYHSPALLAKLARFTESEVNQALDDLVAKQERERKEKAEAERVSQAATWRKQCSMAWTRTQKSL